MQVYFDNTTGKWVTSRAKIAQSYLAGWFWVDVPSSVPVELISLFFDASGLSVLRFLRILRLVRLVKLVKVDEYIETLENAFDMNLRVLRVVLMAIKLAFLCHIMGCLWFSLGRLAKPGEGSWLEDYDEGRPGDPNTTAAIKYHYAVYWSIVTMTTVGYGDLVPVNPGEENFAIVCMLFSSLVFGFMLSSVGVLIASMDRQAAATEDAMDGIKEYIEWRRLPKELGMRVKKHYTFYFQKKGSFNESELVDELSPSLRSEVTRFVLHGTLGQLPLFRNALDPEFQMEVFPYINPVSFIRGEVIFKKGEPSRELLFLLSGEISIKSTMDNKKITAIITRDTETLLAYDGEPCVTLDCYGAVGESVILGLRRPATHVANAYCETLIIEKDDLTTIFEKNPRTGVKIVTTLLASAGRRQRLQGMMSRFMIASLPPESELRAAMILQAKWARVQLRICSATSPLTKMLNKDPAPSAEELAQKVLLERISQKIVALLAELRETVQRTGEIPTTPEDSPEWTKVVKHDVRNSTVNQSSEIIANMRAEARVARDMREHHR